MLFQWNRIGKELHPGHEESHPHHGQASILPYNNYPRALEAGETQARSIASTRNVERKVVGLTPIDGELIQAIFYIL